MGAPLSTDKRNKCVLLDRAALAQARLSLRHHLRERVARQHWRHTSLWAVQLGDDRE